MLDQIHTVQCKCYSITVGLVSTSQSIGKPLLSDNIEEVGGGQT